MTNETNQLLDELNATLEKHAAANNLMVGLSENTNHLLICFLPDQTKDHLEGETYPWTIVAADLADAYTELRQSGISTLVIRNELPSPGMEFTSRLPFSILPDSVDNDPSVSFWKIFKPDTPGMEELAILLDFKSGEIIQIWENAGPFDLVPSILSFLLQKKIISYTMKQGLVQLFENDQVEKRRQVAAQETAETIDGPVSTKKSPQSALFEDMMTDKQRSAPIGLAFSGGGIRSATFNLGITQALARYRFLPWIDYLSSVSGGGFTAGALTSLLSRRNQSRQHFFSTQWEKFPFNPEIKAFNAEIDLDNEEDERENRNFKDVSYAKGHNSQLSYLLKNGNYLVPRLGLATRDLLRGVGTLLSGTGFTILLFVLVMLILACFHYFSASIITPALLEDFDTTQFSREEAQAPVEVLLQVDDEGNPKTIVLPTDQDHITAHPTSADSFSIRMVLFGNYSSTPPPLEQEETRPDTGIFPWPIYLTSFTIGIVASYLAYTFLEATYSFPKYRKKSKPQENTSSRDPFFPRPRFLLRFLWPLLLISTGAFTLNIIAIGSSFALRQWTYPLITLMAGGLLWLLLRHVPSNGTIASNRWFAFTIIILTLLVGAALVMPSLGASFEPENKLTTSWIELILVVGLFIYLIYSISNRDIEKDRWGKHGFDRWEWYDPFALRLILGFMIGVMFLGLHLMKSYSGFNSGTSVFWLWQPAVFFAGSLIFLIAIRLIIQGKSTTWGSSRFRTMIWATLGMNLYSLITALFFAALAVPHILAIGGTESGTPAIPLGTAILSGLWAAFLTQFSGKDTSAEGLLKKIFALPAGIRNFALGFLVLVLWVSLIFMFESILDRLLTHPFQALGYGLIALLVFIALGSLQNFNYLSPHYFFGDRAADVFLKTEVELQDGRVATVRDESGVDLRRISPASSSAPYHLVVTAVNMAGSGHQQDRDRKSRHFLFSKHFVGSDATGYVRTDRYRGGNTHYASTLALSGAAASPGLGTFTFFAQAFMMTLLNIRLGLWWVNPRVYQDLPFKSDEEEKEINHTVQNYEDSAFWPLYLMDEALAKTSERRKLVNITDGGHTRDNGGLYPLFERRCKVIISGDASQDAEGLCPDLFSVLHYVRVDLDIEVDIDISRLQPAKVNRDGTPAGMSDAHCAIGKIKYPPIYRADGSIKHEAMTGWLIYIKPAVSKAMPSEILQFWQTDKNMFPHPTTADQFFSERQFETQRQLGEESVRTSLKVLLDAYETPSSKPEDPGDIKASILRTILNEQNIDYKALKAPGLFDAIMQDWMDTISPIL